MQSYSFEPGRVVTLCVFLALTVLLSLGTWQWRKIEGKTNLIAAIEEGLSGAPKSLSELSFSQDLSYQRVWIEGAFKPVSGLRLFGTNTSGRSGYHHYGLFQDQTGETLLVSVGWTPFDKDEPLSIWPGDGRYSGVLLPYGTKGSFTPDNDRAGNLWYWADLTAMAEVLGQKTDVFPYRVILDDLERPDYPKGGQVRVDIPNDHFEYALTWYGIALGLIGVYGFFGLKRRQALP